MKPLWALLLALILTLQSCGGPSGDSSVIETEQQYAAGITRVRSLSEGPLKAYELGAKLNEHAKSQLVKAEEIVDALLIYAPTRYGAFLLAGKIAQALEDSETARQRYEQALRLQTRTDDPMVKAALADALFQLAAIDLADSRFEESNDHASLAIGLDPKNPEYYASKAAALIGLKRFDQARKALLQARSLQPDNQRVRHLIRYLAEAREASRRR